MVDQWDERGRHGVFFFPQNDAEECRKSVLPESDGLSSKIVVRSGGPRKTLRLSAPPIPSDLTRREHAASDSG